MKITNKLSDIKAFTIFKNKVLTFGLNGDIQTKGLDLLPIVNHNQCLFWKNDFENVSYLNNSLNEEIFDGFSGGYLFKSGFLVIKRTTKKYFYLEEGKLEELGDYLPFSKPILGNYFIKMQKNTEIGIYDYPNSLWQLDISHYGQKRYNHHGEEIDPSTPNTVSGELMGYDNTIVVPLAGGQLLGLNIHDGSFKWLLEFGGYIPVQNRSFIYTFHSDSLLEIQISDGKIMRKMEIKSFFDKIKAYPFNKCISNGKLIIDFSSDYSNLLVIDISKFEIESYIENPYRSMMLRVNQSNCIWHNNQLYARDPMSNTLYIFSESPA